MRHSDAARIEAAYRASHERLWRSLFLWSGRADIASEAESEAFAQVCRCVAEVRDVESWVWRTAFRVTRGLLVERPVVVADAEPIAVAPLDVVELTERPEMVATVDEEDLPTSFRLGIPNEEDVANVVEEFGALAGVHDITRASDQPDLPPVVDDGGAGELVTTTTG